MARQLAAAEERARLWETRAIETRARLAEILRESRIEAARLMRTQGDHAPMSESTLRESRVLSETSRRGRARAAARAALPTLGLVAYRGSLRSLAQGALVIWRQRARAAWRRNFDADYYRRVNPDTTEIGVPPALHYLLIGYREGREPSLHFSGETYLRTNPDAAGWNPLVHFALHGADEGRPFPAPER